MTGIFCLVTFMCGAIFGALVGIVLWEDRH